jgi:hypothetical protein
MVPCERSVCCLRRCGGAATVRSNKTGGASNEGLTGQQGAGVKGCEVRRVGLGARGAKVRWLVGARKRSAALGPRALVRQRGSAHGGRPRAARGAALRGGAHHCADTALARTADKVGECPSPKGIPYRGGGGDKTIVAGTGPARGAERRRLRGRGPLHHPLRPAFASAAGKPASCAHDSASVRPRSNMAWLSAALCGLVGAGSAKRQG